MSLNWNQFEAKFEGRVNEKFEELAYILFCKRFNQSKGILRYKNQKAIESFHAMFKELSQKGGG